MKKIISTMIIAGMLCIPFTMTSCGSSNGVTIASSKPSGNVITAKRQIENSFSAIDVDEVGVSVKYIQGSPASVEITGNEDDVNDLNIYTDKGTLEIKYANKIAGSHKRNNRSLTITVTAPEVVDFECSTGSSFDIANLTTQHDVKIDISTGGSLRTGTIVAPSLDLEISTGGSATLASVQTSKCKIDLSTGASLTISGRSEEADFDVSTGATLNAEKFYNEFVKVDASVGSTVTINANRSNVDSSMATVRNVRR